jgi:hypothetical protein
MVPDSFQKTFKKDYRELPLWILGFHEYGVAECFAVEKLVVERGKSGIYVLFEYLLARHDHIAFPQKIR